MGRRNRERIERIRQGLEKPFRHTVEKLYGGLVPKVNDEDVKAKGIKLVTTKCPDITNYTEIKTCKQIMGLLANPKMPQHIIKAKMMEGMKKVVAKLKKYGESGESTFKFYWDIVEFRELWGKLGYAELDWRRLAVGE